MSITQRNSARGLHPIIGIFLSGILVTLAAAGGARPALAQETASGFYDVEANRYAWLRHMGGEQIGDVLPYTAFGATQFFGRDNGVILLTGQVATTNSSQSIGNVGIVRRLWLTDNTILGVGLWGDIQESRRDNPYQQGGVSLELLQENWAVRANGFMPFGARIRNIFDQGANISPDVGGSFDPNQTRYQGNNIIVGGIINRVDEIAMRGMDVELARSIGNWSGEAFVGYYNLQGQIGGQTNGIKGGVRGYITPSIAANVNISDDPLFGTNVFGGFTWFFGGTGGNAPRSVEDKLTIPVIRNEQVVIRDVLRQRDTSAILTQNGVPVLVMHVNNGGVDGDGTIENPEGSLTFADNNANKANFNIVFVHGDATYGPGQSYTITGNGQRVLGESATDPHLVMADQGTFVMPRATMGPGNRPILIGPGNLITLANQNEVSAFTINNATIGITGAGATLTSDTNINRIGFNNNALDIEILNSNNTTINNITSFGATGGSIHLDQVAGTTNLQNIGITNAAGLGGITLDNVQAGAQTNVLNTSINGVAGMNNGFTTNNSDSSARYDIQNLDVANVGGRGVSLDGGGYLFDANSSIMNTGMTAFAVTGQTFVNYQGSITQSNNATTVGVTNHLGTLTFQTGMISATNGDGLQFNNAGGTYNFLGTTALNGGDAGIDIIGSAGTFTFANADITNPTGDALNVNGGGAIVNYDGGTINNDSGATVNVAGGHSGSITFAMGTTINATGGTGLQFNGTGAGSFYNFDGLVTLNGGDAGIDIVNNSAGTFTFTGLTQITNPTGVAVNIDSSPASVTFNNLDINQSVGAGVLANNSGSLSILGGEIDNTSGDGINSTNTILTVDSVTLGDTTAIGGDGIVVLNSDATSRTIALTNNMITSTGNAIAVQKTGAGDLNLNVSGNTLASTSGAGALINGSAGAGTLFITGFNGNTVTTAGTGGLLVETATFDATPGGAINQVSGGNTNIGDLVTTTNVTGDGLRLNNVLGNIAFGDLNIGNDNGTGLYIRDAGLKGGTFMFSNTGGTINTTNGTAMDVDPVQMDSTFASISSTGGTNGILLNTVDAQGGAGANALTVGTVNISGSTGAGIDISSSTGTFTFGSVGGTTINNAASAGGGVNITNTAADTTTVNFNGGLNIDTMTGTGFAVNGVGGTATTVNVAATVGDESINTTNGQALNLNTVASTTGINFDTVIGSGGTTGISLSNVTGVGGLNVTAARINGATTGVSISGANSTITLGNGSFNPGSGVINGLVIDGGTDGMSITQTAGTLNLGTGTGRVAIGETTTPSNHALLIAGAGGTINIGNATNQSSLTGGATLGANAIQISGASSADVNVTNATTSTGGGNTIALSGPTGALLFTDVSVTGTGAVGDGFSMAEATNVTINGGSINNTGGRGIFAQNSVLTVDGVTFGATGAIGSDGIVIRNTNAVARSVTLSNNIMGSGEPGDTADITGRGVFIDALGSGPLTLSLSGNLIRSTDHALATTDGGAAGSLVLSLNNNTFESGTGVFAVEMVGSGLNSTIVTSLDSNTVTANGTGGGMLFDRVTFDASGTSLSGTQVTGGTTNIGQGTMAAQRVQGDGLSLLNPTGNLGFTTLNIFNNAGTGLEVDTKGLGTTFTLATSGGTINTTGGPAMFLDPLAANLTFTSVTSANSGNTIAGTGAQASGDGTGIHIDTLTDGSSINIGTTTINDATPGAGLAALTIRNNVGTVNLNFGDTSIMDVTSGGASGDGLLITGNSAATTSTFGDLTITTDNGAGITHNDGSTLTVTGTTTINANSPGMNLQNSTGTFNFAGLNVSFSGAERGIDFRNSTVNFTSGNTTITGDGTSGSIGIDLSGSMNAVQPVVTPNITLAGASGQTVAINNVQTGNLLGNAVDGTAGAYLVYGNQVSGSSINTTAGGTTIDTTFLTTNGTHEVGRYEYVDVLYTGGKASFEGSAFFVAETATGAGDGSSINDAATAADAETNSLAGNTLIFLNNGGATINFAGLGGSTFNLKDNQTATTFASVGGTLNIGQGTPANVIGTFAGGTVTDLNNTGTATLTTANGSDVMTLASMNNTIRNLIFEGNNNVTGAARGINDNGAGASGTTIDNVTFQNFATVAVEITPSTNTTISNSTFTNNAQDVLVNAAGTTITNTTSTGATGTAFQILNATGTTTLTNVTVTGAGGAGFDFNNAGGTVTATNVNISGANALSIDGGNAVFTFDGDSSINNTSGTAVEIINRSGGSFTFDGTVVSNGPGSAGITISGATAANNVSFNGAVDLGTTNALGGGAGVSINNNAQASTITFADLDIVTSGQLGLRATNGGTVNVTTGTVSSTGAGATAVELDGITAGMTFGSISADNTGNGVEGIDIDNLSGSFTVTGATTLGATANLGGGININGGGANYSFNGVTVNNLSVAGPNNGIAITGTSGTIGFGTTSITGANNGGNSLRVDSTTGGSVTFSQLTIDAGGGNSAVSLNGNAATIDIQGVASSLSNSANDTFQVSGGAANITYAGSITNTAGRSVNIQNRTGGTVALNGAITDTGTGINLATNTGGSINFTGLVDLDTTTNAAITLNGNNGASITFSNVDIDTTSGVGIAATGANSDVNVSGTVNNSVAGTNVFSFTGTSGDYDYSGVTSSQTSVGQVFNSTHSGNYNLGLHTMTSPGATGVDVQMANTGTINLTYESLTINDPTAAVMTGVLLSEVNGSFTVKGGTINALNTTTSDGIRVSLIDATTNTFTLTAADTQFNINKNDGINGFVKSGSTFNANISGITAASNLAQNAVDLDFDASFGTIKVNDNTIDSGTREALNVTAGNASDITLDVDNFNVDTGGTGREAIRVRIGSASPTDTTQADVFVDGGTLANNGTFDLVIFDARGQSQLRASMTGVTLNNPSEDAIQIDVRESARVDLTATNNVISNLMAGSAFNGNNRTATAIFCLNATGNTDGGGSPPDFGGAGNNSFRFNDNGNGGAMNIQQTSAANLGSLNGGGGAGNVTVVSGTLTFNQACTAPTP
jgi:hypothetical protein